MSSEKELQIYALDLETTTYSDYEQDGYVWCYLWHARNVFGEDCHVGRSMDELFEWMETLKDNTVFWFFNLSYDGRYISDWGMRNGWTSEDYATLVTRKQRKKDAVKVYLDENDLPKYKVTKGGIKRTRYIPKKVTADFEVPRKSMTVIKAGSRWIQLILVNSRGTVIKIYDVGNKYTTAHSLAEIAETIGVDGKTHLDVLKRREPGYIATDEDIERVENDTRITAEAISWFYKWGMTAPTLAGDAWKIYSDMLVEKYGKDTVEKEIYPTLQEKYTFKDGYVLDIREAYFGGRVYLRPQYVDKDVENVSSIDCNSMHPTQMRYRPMPYGTPYLSIGEPKEAHYIVSFTAVFDVKKGRDPTIQRSKSFRSIEAEWVYHSDRAGEKLTMTDIDLKVFLDHYDLEVPFECLDRHYVNFKTKEEELFDMYIDKYTAEKVKHKNAMIECEKKGDEIGLKSHKMEYMRAKILMNALYGKFGQDPVKPYQWLNIGDKDCIKVEESDVEAGEYFEPRSHKYLPTAVFITAWSRYSLIETFEKIPGAIYCDTDSVYYKDNGENLEEMGVKLDKKKLGYWDIEHENEPMARFIRAKSYIIRCKNGKLEVKCGGMPAKVKEHVTWDNFHPGAEFSPETGKLLPRAVKGGVALKNVGYRIRK